MPPELADPLLGRTLGEFVLRERIGQGGFGEVFRAYQPLLAREAVVKILHTRHTGGQTGSQRFLREARLASRIDHPYAAHIYAFGIEKDGLIWIAMELVRGEPLDGWLKRNGRLPLDELVPLLDRLAEVIHTAHEQRIVHRDIKPANVMVLQRAGRTLPKLLDLGIAKLVEDATRRDEADAALLEPLGELPASEQETLPGRNPVRVERVPLEEPRELTRPGAVMGSPPYMAPELWRGSEHAGPRSDLYALGILAYEALTGRRVFTAQTAAAMAHAHAEAPIPPVGPDLPAALDEVFRRALAKRPEARFDNALQLAAAFRAAAGVDRDAEGIPRLAAARASRWSSHAPQPLAEAVAALQGARNPHQARDAVRGIVRALTRWLALGALAALSHARPGGRDALGVVGERLRALRRSDGADEDWLELARAAAAPFRPESHPLPVLVEFLAAPGPLDRLVASHSSAPSLGRADEVRDGLLAALPALDDALAALDRLLDYPLVVADGARPELWSGLRRPYREPVSCGGPAVLDGRPFLIDPHGHPVLALWPLLQVRAPVAGADRELFFYDGSGRHGARLVALPAGFHAEDAGLADWLSAKLLEESGDGHGPLLPTETPYLGLTAFGPGEADRYFGREEESHEALNRLVAEPFLGVVGPSGVGKSSFVQAGLVAALGAGWTAITLRPGPAPRVALAAQLARLGVGELDPEATAAAVRQVARDRGVTVLVVVDQLEELFTQGADAEERGHFAAILAALARSAADPVRVVVTLRDDFLMRAQALPPLRPLFGRGLLLVGVPAPADLLRIVTEPARRAGYEFDDPALPAEMVREVGGQPGALPLLSFTAARLWERRDRQFQHLTRRAYAAMDGVAGALAQHAEETLARLTGEEQRGVRECFRQLVTAEGTRAIVTRRELADLLGDTAVVDRLIDARLLVSDEDHRVEIIHEALVGAWPRLAAWRREDAEGARLRDELRAVARQWEARGRPRGLLWRDEALVELEAWRTRHAPQLTDGERQFAQASAAARARRRRAGFAAVSGIILALTTAVVLLLGATARATRSEEKTRHTADALRASYLAELEEQGRQALLAGRTDVALERLLLAVREGAPQTAALRFMVAEARRPSLALEGKLEGHTAKVREARFSPDGGRVVTAAEDGTAIVWDARSHARLATLAGCPRRVLGLGFRADRVLTTCDDGKLREYAIDGRLIAEVRAAEPSKEALVVVVTPDGKTVLTGGAGGTLTAWDAETWRPRWRREQAVWTLAVSPDGALLAAPDDLPGSETQLLRVATGEQVGRLASGVTPFVEFTPSGQRLVTVGIDQRVRVWDVVTRRVVVELAGTGAPLAHAALHPRGTRLATASRDGAVSLWDPAEGRLIAALRAPGNASATWVRFDPSGRLLAAGLSDGGVALWDATSGTLLTTLRAHAAPLTQVELSPGGERLVAASFDHTASIWRTDGFSHRIVRAHAGAINVAAPLHGREAVLTCGDDGEARVWSPTADGPLAATSLGEAVTACAAADDGTVLLGGDRGTVARWSTGAPVRLAVHEGSVVVVDVTPDGGWGASSSVSGAVHLYALPEGTLVRALGDQTGPSLLAFAPDGRRLAVGDREGQVRLYDAPGWTRRAGARVHGDQIYHLAWSPDGRRLASGAGDALVQILDDRAAILQTLAGHTGNIMELAWSGDDRLLTTSQDSTGRVWRLGTTGSVTLAGHNRLVPGGAWRPDGELVLTGGEDQTVRVWDAATGREIGRLAGHTKLVGSVGFLAGGTTAFSVDLDGVILWWDLASPAIP